MLLCRPLFDLHKRPRLVSGQGSAFANDHTVTHLTLVILIMHQQLGSAAHILTVNRVFDPTFRLHSDCFIHPVTDDTTGDGALMFGLPTHNASPIAALSFKIVLTRAISLRTLEN
jgi:hypothetical protein